MIAADLDAFVSRICGRGSGADFGLGEPDVTVRPAPQPAARRSGTPAATEITSSPGSHRFVQGLTTGAPTACVDFYAEHEADAVHEQVLRHDVVGNLLRHELELVSMSCSACGHWNSSRTSWPNTCRPAGWLSSLLDPFGRFLAR